MVFANPNYLYLLLLLIPMIGWYVYKLSKSQASLQVSSSEAFEAPGAVSWIVYLRHVPFVLRMVAVALLIVILARPQSTNSWSNSSTEGIDIMLAMDISGSMLAQDLKPNRLEAAKDVAASFINGRPNDNIGLVVFSAESFTQCPLTTDHTVLLNLFKDIQSGMIQDGTAIGLGLANAVSRIKDSHAKSKVIILLTDGSNNAGEIAPVTAADDETAEFARKQGVVIFLNAGFDTCYERIKNDSNRPLVVNNTKEQLKAIYDSRLPVYRKNSTFEVNANASDRIIAGEIIKLVELDAKRHRKTKG